MTMSEACIAGIEKNGLKWMARGPMIKDLATEVGNLRNMADDGKLKYSHMDRITAVAQAIGTQVEAWASQIKNEDVKADFTTSHEEDIEALKDMNVELDIRNGLIDEAEEAIEDIVHRLNSLYDFFDYYRILVR